MSQALSNLTPKTPTADQPQVRSRNSDNVLLKRTQSTFKIQHLEKKVIMKSGEMPELALAMLQGPKAAAAVSTKRKGFVGAFTGLANMRKYESHLSKPNNLVMKSKVWLVDASQYSLYRQARPSWLLTKYGLCPYLLLRVKSAKSSRQTPRYLR